MSRINKINLVINKLISLTVKNEIDWYSYIEEDANVYETKVCNYGIEIIEDIDEDENLDYFICIYTLDELNTIGSINFEKGYNPGSPISILIDLIGDPSFDEFDEVLDIILDKE